MSSSFIIPQYVNALTTPKQELRRLQITAGIVPRISPPKFPLRLLELPQLNPLFLHQYEAQFQVLQTQEATLLRFLPTSATDTLNGIGAPTHITLLHQDNIELTWLSTYSLIYFFS